MKNLPPVCSPRGPNCTNSPIIVFTEAKWSAIFWAAVLACAAEQGRRINAAVLESAADDTTGLDAALRRLRGRARPAVFCGNAVISLRVAAAAARLGWQLGHDLGLIGFDETEWAPLVGPGLSTLAQPTDELGRHATRCLLERLQGLAPPPRQILLPAQLVVRGSTLQA